MSEELIKAEGLSKSFETGESSICVLDGVDLGIRRGDTVAIVGQSGVGKSTLLHILGILDHPSSGTLRYSGEDVFQQDDADLARLRNEFIGFVFQFHHLLPEFNALENVMMPGLIRGLAFPEMRRRATDMIEEVGLSHRLRHPVGKLSGGERQRVAVARALVLDPPVVLADEPTGNLDPATGEQIADLLLGINRTRGTALVIVTHSRAMAKHLDRTLLLQDGRLRELATDESAPEAALDAG
jgi:lipoprotein-releasing system ATP-binding protein